MTAEQITPQTSQRICNHMNKDHSEAIQAYASHYAGIQNAKEVLMMELTSELMKLKVNQEIIQIRFDHKLIDTDDAHQTLVSMLKSIPKS